MARGLKFWIYDVEGLYYLCSENKGAAAEQQLFSAFVRILAKIRFSRDAAQLLMFAFAHFLISKLYKVF